MEQSRVDVELPNQMANLDIMEIEDGNLKAPEQVTLMCGQTQRVLRKRKSVTSETLKSSNRRVSMKPRKHIITENENPKQIEALYLNKKVKTVSQTLETIYEEPKTENNDNTNLIGGRKIKRLLTFPICSQYTKDKIKKRRAKIKKLFGTKTFINRKKIPMPVFLETLQCLELDEPVQTETIISNKA